MTQSPVARRLLSIGILSAALLSAACDDLVTGRAGKIRVSPAEVVFRNATPRAEPYTQVLSITNIGTARLNITNIAYAGDAQFTLTPDGGEPPQTRLALDPQQTFRLTVYFYAVDLLPRTGELRIESTDLLQPKVTVGVRNEDISPRIVVTHCVRQDSGGCIPGAEDLRVVFGDVRQGQCRTAEVTVENFGQADLEVQQPTFDPTTSPDFAWDGAPPGAFTVRPIDEQGVTQKQTLLVKYCPMTSTSARGNIVLATNDPQNPQVFVALEGGALTNQCPVCNLNPSTLEVAPLDTINLSGAGCTDPDGQPLQFAWTVEQRPPGSTAQLRNANSRDATFFVDLATTPTTPYVFRVTATDTWNCSAHAEVTVFAIPRDALHVQLVWDKDETDVDLHLLNPAGSANRWASTGWFSLANDCYYLNRSPDWGVAGNAQDNPRLDIDDVNGFGPENINISRPQSGRFSVGVHYFCDDQLGASRSTVRVFCNGAEAAEFGPKNLPASGFFWEVATIDWPGCVIAPIDQTRTVPQGCQGFGF